MYPNNEILNRNGRSSSIFPAQVYAKLCTVKSGFESNNLESIIRRAFNLDGQRLTLNQVDDGQIFVWDEVESIVLEGMKWTLNPPRSLVLTAQRAASLTQPLRNGVKILGIFATSSAVASIIFRTIHSIISTENMEAEDDGLILSSSTLTNLEDNSINDIGNFSVRYLESSSFSFASYTFKHTTPVSLKKESIHREMKLGNINTIGTVLLDTPIIIKENELIIRNSEVEFTRLPTILKAAYKVIRRID